jgi:hypothetical protein
MRLRVLAVVVALGSSVLTASPAQAAAAARPYDFNGDGHAELVGAPRPEVGSADEAGSGRGITTTGARTFGLTTLGYAHPAGAQFGATLGQEVRASVTSYVVSVPRAPLAGRAPSRHPGDATTAILRRTLSRVEPESGFGLGRFSPEVRPGCRPSRHARRASFGMQPGFPRLAFPAR